MNSKTLIYGLGRAYEKEKNWIESNLENVFFSDIDTSYKCTLKNRFIIPSDIKDLEFDRIIITSRKYFQDIFRNLKSMGIPEHCIYSLHGEKNRIIAQRIHHFISFAERGEDYVIYSLLCKHGFEIEKIRYIDIGVNDPIYGNNTYALYLNGALGTCIDADPRVIDILKVDRRGDIIMHRAVTDRRNVDKVSFYLATSTALSSCIRESVEQWKGIKVEEEIDVEAITINDIFAVVGDGVEVLSIDVEGMDRRILYSMNFEKYRPFIICAEIGVPEVELTEFMRSKGYRMLYNNRVNGIWVRS